jgi:Tol biopolymer transport system component
MVLFDDPDSAPFYIYWSPDNRSVTFLTQEMSGLSMRLADASSPGSDRLLAEGTPFYWVWSPEGDQLFMHVGGAGAFSDDAHLSFLENKQGAARVKLKLAPGSFQAPVWSASGQYVFYIATDDEGAEAIYRTDMETSAQRLIAPLTGTTFMVLSPDDRHIAYLQFPRAEQESGFGTAHIVDIEGENGRQLLEESSVNMYWSPDGTKLALLTPTASGRFRWWVYDMETEVLEPLVSFVPTLDFSQTVPYFDQYHQSLTFWSPDSRYFVITKRDPGSQDGSVWVLDTMAQEAPRQIGEGIFAVWSWQ